MTVALAIITQALRESNIIPIGQTPTVDHQNEAFDRLSNLIASAYAAHNLKDWPVGVADYNNGQQWTGADWIYPREDSRILYNMVEPTTLYLPSNPQEGARIAFVDVGNTAATYAATLNGNGRPIEGLKNVVLATNGLSRSWVYRADLGSWVRISDMADINADVPFPAEFDDYFITRLAMRLNPRFGRSLAAESATTLQEMENAFNARYNNRRRAVPPDRGALQMNWSAPGRTEDPYNPSIDG